MEEKIVKTIEKIDGKISELNLQKTTLEKKLADEKATLQCLLTQDSLSELTDKNLLVNSRRTVAELERTIAEIGSIVRGLGLRKTQEENNLKSYRVTVLQEQIDKTRLALYKKLREILLLLKEKSIIDADIEKLKTVYSEYKGQLEGLGILASVFDAPNDWYEKNPNAALSGNAPWDIAAENEMNGLEYLENLIASLEK